MYQTGKVFEKPTTLHILYYLEKSLRRCVDKKSFCSITFYSMTHTHCTLTETYFCHNNFCVKDNSMQVTKTYEISFPKHGLELKLSYIYKSWIM